MQDYFVAAAGKVANSGTAIGAEWPISKITSQGWLPDDRIRINANDTFVGTIGLSRSGTAGHPIIIDLYGAGPNPTWDGGASNTPVFSFASGVHDVIINNIIAKNSKSPNGIFFAPANCYNITWNNCYISQGIRGINAVKCLGGLKILGNYFQAIADNATHSNGGGSHVQLNNCNGGGIEVGGNFSFEPTPNTGIGDLLSIYQCNGLLGDEILIHDNKARGGSTNTNGYCHIVIGDVGGSHQKCYNNKSANPGMEAYQVQGGRFCYMYNNQSYSDASNPVANVGIAFGNYSGAPCDNIDIHDNQMCWKRPNGSFLGKFIDQALTSSRSTASGVAGGPILALPPGWNTNTGANSCDGTITNAVVPSPLWTGSPWSTITTGLVFGPLTSRIYGAANFSPGATSTNAITYTSSNPAVATIVGGNIHIVAAGTSTITANDGTSSIAQLLTVNKVPLTVTASAASKTYGAANPALSAVITGYVLGESGTALTTQPAVTTTAVTGSNAGTYPITPSGGVAANYSFIYVAAVLTVNKANLTITGNNASRNYAVANPAFGVTYAGFVNGNNAASLTTQPTISTPATISSNAGTYAITPAGAASPNYNISYVAGTLTVNKVNLTITVNNVTRQFNTVNPVLTVNFAGFVNGNTNASLTAQPVPSTTAVLSSPIGNYPITASGAASPNYTFTYVPGTMTVSANSIVFGPIAPKNYGDADFGAGATSSTAIAYTSDNPAVATIVGGLVHIVGAGSANITANNGTTTLTQPLTVNPAPLTITADSHVIFLGNTIPFLGVTYSGFMNADTSSVLTSIPVVTTPAVLGSPIGNYSIDVTGAVANNYVMNNVSGNLSIVPAGSKIHCSQPVILLT